MRTLFTVVLNLGLLIAAWYAVNGHAPAGNIIKVMAAFSVLGQSVALASALNPGGAVIPRWREWLSHISDAILVGILTWHGWLWCGFAFMVSWFATYVMFLTKRKSTHSA